MAATTRITVTLPADLAAELKNLTDNVSGYVAEAVARQIRLHLRKEDLRRYEEQYGAFTEEELTEAAAKISGSAEPARHSDVA